jgi:molybdopterin-guanine dinucleotide biosynthesis protein A
MTLRRVTGVVLAGGRSRRFGRDKLAERIDGRILLDGAIDGVTPAATEILVVAAPDGAPDLPAGVRLVHDPVAFEGPLAGVAAGLKAAREPIVLVVGGDMPTLVGAVIDSMLAALDAPGVGAVVLEHEGRARPLPVAIHRDSALAAADVLLASGERRMRALIETLETTVIPETTWRALDPYGMTVRDIDTPADLE